MIDYKINEQQLDSFLGLKQFLMTSTPAEFAQFKTEAMETRHYPKLFKCALIKETSLSALSLCVIMGKQEHVEYLLSLGCFAPESEDNLALRLAALNGHVHLVNRLLAADEVRKRITLDHNFVLRAAILNANIELFNLLLQFQDIQREITVDQNVALGLAAETGNETIFNNLLVFPEVQEQISACRNEALRLAAEGGYTNIVNRLLTFSAVVRNITVDNNHPLKIAIKNGHEGVVNALLAFDAVQIEVMRQPEEYLTLAAQYGHYALVERLLLIPDVSEHAKQPHCRAFNVAIKQGNIHIVRLFVSMPEIRRRLSDPHNSALSLAAKEGHLDVLDLFLSITGISEVIDATGNGLLNEAAANGHSGVVKRLLEFESVWLSAAVMNNHALCLALKKGDAASAKALLELPHVRVNAGFNHNYPLRLAAANGLGDIVNDLLTITSVQDNAAILGNGALFSAAQNGHFSVVCRLLMIPSVLSIVSSENNRILQEVVKNNHTSVALCLLNIPHVRHNVAVHANSTLVAAARHGNLDIVQALLHIDAVQRLVDAKGNRAFYVACEQGHLPVVRLLLTYPSVSEHITHGNNESLYRAAKNGHLHIIKELLCYRQVVEQVAVDDNAVFRVAVAQGHTEIALHLLQIPAVRRQVDAANHEALKLSAQKGYLEIFNELLRFPQLADCIPLLIHDGLCVACAHGQNDIVARLFKIEGVRLNAFGSYGEAFLLAVKGGHLPIVRQFLALNVGGRGFEACARQALILAIQHGHGGLVSEFLQYEAIQRVLASNGNEALRKATLHNQLDIVNTLLMFPEVRATVGASNHLIYRLARREEHLQIIHVLLNIPEVFAYAELNESRHGGRCVFDHIMKKIIELNNRKTIFEAAHRNGMFDVDLDEAQLLFHMLKYLIRERAFNVQREMTILLAIPRLASILHTAITPGVPNELLQLALNQRNQGAITLLLAFPDVRRIAAENNYYHQPEGIDITEIVRNHESAMLALTPIEQAQLQSIQNKYRPQIDRLGGNNRVLASFKQQLQERYLSNPAEITRGGARLKLPFSFNEFQQLNLVGEDRLLALKAYYAHPDHTAHRFLSKPNPWIHPRAKYVEIDPRHPALRSACFDNYIPMICEFWLAAGDTTAHGAQGYTTLARQEYLIKELAMLGRAHNWDRSRPVFAQGPRNEHQRAALYLRDANDRIVQEEYDDGEADKPSCNMGIKQRVFRSLQDHPLFQPLTIDHIDEHMRKMVAEHYQQLFRTIPHLKTIQEAIDHFIIDCDALPAQVIELNISDIKINEFISELCANYGGAFQSNLIFESHIRSRFALDLSPSHIVNFYESFNIGHILTMEVGRQALTDEACAPINPSLPCRRRASASSVQATVEGAMQQTPPIVQNTSTSAPQDFRRRISLVNVCQQKEPSETGMMAPPAITGPSPMFFARYPRSTPDASEALSVFFV